MCAIFIDGGVFGMSHTFPCRVLGARMNKKTTGFQGSVVNFKATKFTALIPSQLPTVSKRVKFGRHTLI